MLIYTFSAIPQTDVEYLIGVNSLVHTLKPFALVVPGGAVASATSPTTYQIKKKDGTNAVGAYSWLTVDILTLKLTVNTQTEADSGIYEFMMEGYYDGSPTPATTTFKIYIVTAMVKGGLP